MRSSSRNRDWFRPKAYCHFDYRLAHSDREAVEIYVSDPIKVKEHSFLPLIAFEKSKASVVQVAPNVRRINRKKTRPIAFSGHWDSQLLSFYSRKLTTAYETWLTDNNLSEEVIAFRCLNDPVLDEPMSNAHFANRAFESIKRLGPCEVWAFDIKSFFNSLDPKILKRAWCRLLGTGVLPDDHYQIWRFMTETAVIDRSVLNSLLNPPGRRQVQRHDRVCTLKEFIELVRPNLYKRSEGIPQGTPISAVLANIYMTEFDLEISRSVRAVGGFYFRYCDDLLIIIPAGKSDGVENFVSSELAKIGLALNIEKTDHTKFRLSPAGLRASKAIQYLGFTFDGNPAALRQSSISKYRARVYRAVDAANKTKISANLESIRNSKSPQKLYTKSLNRQFRHFGQRNFSSYALNASRILNSPTIRRQAKKLDQYSFRLINEKREPISIVQSRNDAEGLLR